MDGRIRRQRQRPEFLVQKSRGPRIRRGWRRSLRRLHGKWRADVDPQQHYRQANAVFRNLRQGTFRDVTDEAGAGIEIRAAHRGCAFGDLNNDGKIDVVVSAIGSPAELLYNTSPDNNHWILIQ